MMMIFLDTLVPWFSRTWPRCGQVCDRARFGPFADNETQVGERFLPTMAWNNTATQYKTQKLNFPPKFNVSNFTFHWTNQHLLQDPWIWRYWFLFKIFLETHIFLRNPCSYWSPPFRTEVLKWWLWCQMIKYIYIYMVIMMSNDPKQKELAARFGSSSCLVIRMLIWDNISPTLTNLDPGVKVQVRFQPTLGLFDVMLSF